MLLSFISSSKQKFHLDFSSSFFLIFVSHDFDRLKPDSSTSASSSSSIALTDLILSRFIFLCAKSSSPPNFLTSKRHFYQLNMKCLLWKLLIWYSFLTSIFFIRTPCMESFFIVKVCDLYSWNPLTFWTVGWFPELYFVTDLAPSLLIFW